MKETPNPHNLFGVNKPLWHVAIVVAGAAIGALVAGDVYSSETTLSAVGGLIAGGTRTKSKHPGRWF